MRKIIPGVGVLLVGVSVAAMGCGQAGHADAAGVASPTRAAASACPIASSVPVISVTEADDHTTICLAVGQRIRVVLRGTPASLWQPITATGDALAPVADGALALVRDATGAAFVSVHRGQARVMSSRRPCASSQASSSLCQTTGSFEVMVVVH